MVPISPQEIGWQDQDLSPRRDAGSVQPGLSEGSVLAVDARPSQPVSVQNPRKNTQKRFERLLELITSKVTDGNVEFGIELNFLRTCRRKLAPLDSIGGFLMSRSRIRQVSVVSHYLGRRVPIHFCNIVIQKDIVILLKDSFSQDPGLYIIYTQK